MTRARRRAVLLLLASTLLGGLSPRARAEDRWSAPAPLYASDGYAAAPTLLSDSSGRIHLFFLAGPAGTPKKSTAVMYAQRDADGSWSAPVPWVTNDGPEGAMLFSLALAEDGWLHAIFRGRGWGRADYRRIHLSHLMDPDAWRGAQTLSDSGILSAQIVSVPPDTLHLVFASNRNQVFYRRSDDGGRNWSDAVQISTLDPTQQACDRPHLAVDGRGRLHAVWTQAHLPKGWPPAGVFYSRSLDGGATWSAPRQFSGDNYTSINVVTRGDDEIHLAWNALAFIGDRMHAWSSDGGATWSTPQVVTHAIHGGNTGSPGLAFDSNGILHMVTSVDGPHDVERVYHLAWDGHEWSAPQFVSKGIDASDSVEFPDLVIADGNRLSVAFEGDYRSIWYAEERIDAPSLAPRPVPTMATDLRARLRDSSLSLRVFLVVLALFGVEAIVEAGWRGVRRMAR